MPRSVRTFQIVQRAFELSFRNAVKLAQETANLRVRLAIGIARHSDDLNAIAGRQNRRLMKPARQNAAQSALKIVSPEREPLAQRHRRRVMRHADDAQIIFAKAAHRWPSATSVTCHLPPVTAADGRPKGWLSANVSSTSIAPASTNFAAVRPFSQRTARPITSTPKI